MHIMAGTERNTYRPTHMHGSHVYRSIHVEKCTNPEANHMKTKPFPHSHPNSALPKLIQPERDSCAQIHLTLRHSRAPRVKEANTHMFL